MMHDGNYNDYKEQKQHGETMLPLALYHVVHDKLYLILPCHWHEEMEFLYMVSGKAVFTVEEGDYLVHAGDCLFIRGGQIHSGFAESSHVEYYSIVFSENLLTNPFDAARLFFDGIVNGKYQINTLFQEKDPAHTKIISEVKALTELLQKKNTAYELAVKGTLYSIFYCFFSENLYTINEESYKSSLQFSKYEMLKKILAYLYSNYNRKIRITDISSHVNLTPPYLCSFFKK